ATGNADDACALQLGDLPDDAADRTGRAGDDDRVTGLQLARVEQTEVRRHAGHAERTEEGRQRREAGVDLVDLRAGDDGVFLYAEQAAHMVAIGKVRVLRFDDFTNRQRAHHLADRDRRDVRLGVIHPTAHRRVERNVEHLQ